MAENSEESYTRLISQFITGPTPLDQIKFEEQLFVEVRPIREKWSAV